MTAVRRLSLPTWPILAATIALLALNSGCKKDPAPPATGTAAPSAASAPSTALLISGAAETPVLTGLPVLAMLPSTTAAVAAIDGIIPMAGRLGYLEAAKAHPTVLAPVASFMTEYVGVDLTNLDKFSEIGIEPKAPVGAAILRDGMFSVALFATVSDAGKLATALGSVARKAGGSLSSEIVGDATVHRIAGQVRMGRHVAWVVRGAVGLMIISAEEAAPVARDIASRHRDQSLASSVTLPSLLSDLGRGAHGAAWLDVESVVAAAAPVLRDMFGRDARERVEAMVSSNLGANPAVTLGLAVRDSSVELTGRFSHEPNAPIKALLKRDSGRPAIVHALVKPPLYLAGCRCDIQAVYRTIRKVVAGTDGQQVVASFAKTMLGVDVEKLNELFSGELGFAVTGNLDFAALDRMNGAESEAALKASLGGAIVIGVTDAARVKALVDGALRLVPEAVRAAVKEVPGGWTIDVPEWKVVTARLSADLLVVASDVDTAESVIARKPLKLTGVAAEAAAVLEADDAAIVGAVDMHSLFALLRKREGREYSEAAEPVPGTADKALLADYEAKKKAIEVSREAEEAERKELEAAVNGLFGVWAGRAVAGPKGIDGILSATTAKPTRQLFPTVFAFEAADQARRELSTTRWKAEGELRELRSQLMKAVPVEGTVPFEAAPPSLPVEPIVPPAPVEEIIPVPPVPPEAPRPPG